MYCKQARLNADTKRILDWMDSLFYFDDKEMIAALQSHTGDIGVRHILFMFLQTDQGMSVLHDGRHDDSRDKGASTSLSSPMHIFYTESDIVKPTNKDLLPGGSVWFSSFVRKFTFHHSCCVFDQRVSPSVRFNLW